MRIAEVRPAVTPKARVARRPAMLCHGRMQSWVRRVVTLLVAVFAAAVGIVATGSPAYACTCTKSSLAEYAASADAAFTGTLTDIRLGPGLPDSQPDNQPTRRSLRYVLAVEKIYQGTLPATVARVAPQPVRRTCELGQLPVGKRYLFFVDLVEEAPMVGGQCSGTQRLTASVLSDLEAMYAATPAPDPEPVKATRTLVDDSDPIEFARLAAPGAALVLVGALALAVVSRVGRDDSPGQ
jgi:hypothetical protein